MLRIYAKKIEIITTTVVTVSRGYIFNISLRMNLSTVVKLFPTKLKHNRYFIQNAQIDIKTRLKIRFLG